MERAVPPSEPALGHAVTLAAFASGMVAARQTAPAAVLVAGPTMKCVSMVRPAANTNKHVATHAATMAKHAT